MKDVVKVPDSLLTDPDLPASAKLIWMIARLWPGPEPVGTTWLVATSGLSRPTVLTALARAAGWTPTEQDLTLPIPAALLTNRRLSIHARLLYGVLLLTPGFHHPSGQFSIAELAGLAHASPKTVTRALSELSRAEWVKVERANRLARIHFELTFPGLSRGMTALAAAQKRLERAPYFGEALMREYLTLLIDSAEYEDDASPGFLVNPRTEELLQFDRFYPPNVAFEFNGPQHYVDMAQRERDYIKLGICASRGVTLVTIHAEDLSIDGMRQKVRDLLPLRNLAGYDLPVDYLEAESRRYRRLSNRKLQ